MRLRVLALALCLTLLLPAAGLAEFDWITAWNQLHGAPEANEAPDITSACTLRSPGGNMVHALCDGSYEYPWRSARARTVSVEIQTPENRPAYGLAVKWASVNAYWQVEARTADGWQPVAEGDHTLLHTYTALPGLTAFRIVARQRCSDRLAINELTVLGEGDTPGWVQRWQPTPEKADLLLIAAHPDDEYVFMGGAIPYYAAERGLNVLVAYITESTFQRRSELLDGLWTAGLRQYPLIGRFHDRYTLNLREAYKRVGERKAKQWIMETVRRYKPDVMVTHDVKGEYGHGVHRVAADLALYAAQYAGDAKKDPKSAKQWGVWDIPKLYLHLWAENELRMDWGAPLAAFDGCTAFEVADAAFLCHTSQQHTPYVVYRDGPYDSARFGLARSLVGPDQNGNDWFEHLPQGEAGV